MRNFHENLVNAVLKHVKSGEQLDQWLRGDSMVVFEIGAQRGVYVGNGMLRLETGGGLIDLDPGKVTGARFQLIIREEDAELAFKGMLDAKETAEANLAAVTRELRALQEDSANQIEKLNSELTAAGDRESAFNAELDKLQEEQFGTEVEPDPGSGSEDTVSEKNSELSNGPLAIETAGDGTTGFSDDTKAKAGIPLDDEKEKVVITKDDIGTLDVKDLGLDK